MNKLKQFREYIYENGASADTVLALSLISR